jgi:hypothetical protein
MFGFRNPIREQCGTCRFWLNGRCHEQSPRPSTPFEAMVDELGKHEAWQDAITVWPKTEEGQWCGKWKRRD